jgi:hypothetical protein
MWPFKKKPKNELVEFEKAVESANELMVRTDEVLATNDEAAIRQLGQEIVSMRACLRKKSAELLMAEHDHEKVLEIAGRFDSSPIKKLMEYLATC